MVDKFVMEKLDFKIWFEKQSMEIDKAHIFLDLPNISHLVFTFLWFHKEFNMSYSTGLLIACRIDMRV